MPLNYSFDDLFPQNLRWLLELQERVDAAVNPWGKMQKGLEAAMRLQRLTEGLPKPPAWLDAVGTSNAVALSQRVHAAFQTYNILRVGVPELGGLARINTLGPTLPPSVVDLVANLERTQQSFFQNWASLALAIEQPAWLQQIETLHARFEQLLADLPPEAETGTVEEFAAGASLRTAVFELGTAMLVAPSLASHPQFQAVITSFSDFLAAPAAKDARDWLGSLIACLTFIFYLRDEWRKRQLATATASETALQQERAQNRTQLAMLQMQLARQNNEVRSTRRALKLYSRPAKQATQAGHVPANTELAITCRVRKWLHVVGFDAAGQLQQGWVLEVRLPLGPPPVTA